MFFYHILRQTPVKTLQLDKLEQLQVHLTTCNCWVQQELKDICFTFPEWGDANTQSQNANESLPSAFTCARTHRCPLMTTCREAIKSSSSESWYHSNLSSLSMWPLGTKNRMSRPLWANPCKLKLSALGYNRIIKPWFNPDIYKVLVNHNVFPADLNMPYCSGIKFS